MQKKRWAILFALVATFQFLPADQNLSEAYRLANDIDGVSIVPLAKARLWSENAWPPGGELVFNVTDDPEWALRFDSHEEILQYVTDALEVWTEIPGTDIRWRVEGVVEPGDFKPNQISISTDSGTYAGLWVPIPEPGDLAETVGCTIGLDVKHVALPDDLPDSDRDDRPDGALIHELGHCLGIDHAALTPTVRATLPWTGSSVWSEDPRMSYGVHRGAALLGDDVTAALLVRPLPGWLEATGSVSGRLTLDGAPARFAVVEVMRRVGSQVRPAASVFSNRQGEFLAEGLAPGSYFLWVHPFSDSPAHGDLVADAARAFDDLLHLQPVRVRPGEVSGGHDFELRGGRVLQ